MQQSTQRKTPRLMEKASTGPRPHSTQTLFSFAERTFRTPAAVACCEPTMAALEASGTMTPLAVMR